MAAKRKIGRPSKYTPQLASTICDRIANGEMLPSICDTPDIPAMGTVLRWAATLPVFRELYERAREVRLERMAEEMIEIADESSHDTISTERGEFADKEWIMRSKLRVETRQWLLARLARQLYGDRVQQEISGPAGGPLQTELTIRDLTRDTKRPDGSTAPTPAD